jgi:hypothetical protein
MIECPVSDLLTHLSTADVCGAEVDTEPHPRVHHLLARGLLGVIHGPDTVASP